MERARGFTLIEIMIAMGVVAIVTATATMAYKRYAFRARRTDAHHMLLLIAHSEERWYATYNRYTDDLEKLGYDTQRATSAHGYYQLLVNIDDATAQSYDAMAIPVGAQASDTCGVLKINNAGQKTPNTDDIAGNANGRCW